MRIIDIKLTAEPSPAYFAELAYYGMTLAGWLEHHGLSDRFVVLADAAIWPGNHDGSALKRREREDARAGTVIKDLAHYLDALDEDLEEMPAEVVLGRVIRFLAVDLREALEPDDWRELPWHVDGRCIGCDYLGYEWFPADRRGGDKDQRYCWPSAEASGHLSRIAGLTEGACGKLAQHGVADIAGLANLRPASRIFEAHHALRATRHIVHARAESLARSGPARVPDRSGTSAVLPRFSDIQVALSVDFDIGSGLTFAIGYHVSAGVPKGLNQDPSRRAKYEREPVRRERVMLVLEKSVESEGAVFAEVLARLQYDVEDLAREITNAALQVGNDDDYKPTIQFYLWDRLTFDQLCRMMGRHLLRVRAPVEVANRRFDTSPMVWIFPPEQVIEDADYATRNSPITIVSDAVRLLAANIPHHYSQLELATQYQPPNLKKDGTPFVFSVRSFFMDPLSDQIPSERGHEVWNRSSPFKTADYQEYRALLKAAVLTKLSATLAVVRRLVLDLGDTLHAEAPTVARVFGRGARLDAVANDSQVIYQHARLMKAAEELEIDLLMAMPPFEREARFASVRIEAHLQGAAREHALRSRGLAHEVGDPDVYVFRMCERSREAKIKAGEFNLSLMPEDRLDLQHRIVAGVKRDNPMLGMMGPVEPWEYRTSVRKGCKITVLRFDRVDRIVIVRVRALFQALVQLGIFNLAFDPQQGRFGIIDPLHADYFVGSRLVPALRAIKVPPLSLARPLFPAPDVARVRAARPRPTESVPLERFVWDADALAHEVSGRPVDAALAALVELGRPLTERQREAIEQALTTRLCLLWGPPGTGKSATAVAMIVALVADAEARGEPIRIAVTGPTWVAIDNVMAELPAVLADAKLQGRASLARLMSPVSPDESADPRLRDFVVKAIEADPRAQALVGCLQSCNQSCIVAGTAEQLAQLAKLGGGGLQPFFDFMLIDEASQMDVAHAIVAFTALAENASVTVVGDDKQMAPIHPIEAPQGAEHLVGSIYDFYRHYRKGEPGAHGIRPIMLNVNFRSNAEIVEFVRRAGYDDDLRAEYPNLRMRLANPIPRTAPPAWPAALGWSDGLGAILNPDEPLTAVVHPDRFSSQRNEDEAKLVASLVGLLRSRLLPLTPGTSAPFNDVDLFKEGVGVVTPHRAQQAAVIDQIEQNFRLSPEATAAMYDAVDTVERFQGQQKVVMLASFGIGDADQIGAEEEFLYSLNRFNVIASRARAKLIVIMSRRMADYLPRDLVALRESRLLKHFVDGHLRRSVPLALPGLEVCELRLR